jgi:antitoxin VapB
MKLEMQMATAKVFKSGNSQAVRLPKEFHMRTKELEIERRGDEIVLREGFRGMERVFYLIADLGNLKAVEKLKKNDKPQKRKGL